MRLRSRWHLQRSNGAREVADIARKGGRDHFQTWNERTWRVAGGYQKRYPFVESLGGKWGRAPLEEP